MRPEDLYAQMGIAALLPGMTRALEILQAEVDSMRALLERAQAGQSIVTRKGRPPGIPNKKANGSVPVPEKRARVAHSYWAKMTPEQRSAEMKRRQMVSTGKAKSQDKRVAKDNPQATAVKNSWAKLSKKEKAARVAVMNKARLAKMAAASEARQ